MAHRYFSDKLVKWYEIHFRNLPWRTTDDPYKIWLSEIILQQTRVVQGLPYYLQFTEKYPTVQKLAKAKEEEVLRLWQGLGYYSRARNLHKCAKTIVEKYNSQFPQTFEELKTLPGIGDYTAAAIASFAFKEAVPVVDGNVYRVLARAFGIADDIAKPQTKKIFFEKALTLIDPLQPDLFNQATMELGATVCTPANPNCEQCPINGDCYANVHGMQGVLPVKKKASPARKRYFYYFIIKKGNALAMNKRERKDIWQGLYDFYLVEQKRSKKVTSILLEDKNLKSLEKATLSSEVSKIYRHVLSHQIILARFVVLNVDAKTTLAIEGTRFYPVKKIFDLPKPVLINRFLNDFKFYS